MLLVLIQHYMFRCTPGRPSTSVTKETNLKQQLSGQGLVHLKKEGLRDTIRNYLR